jgi:hypothetical protein
MAVPADAARALAFVRQQAAARRVVLTEKAMLELRSVGEGLAANDIRECLCTATDGQVVSYEPDQTRPDRTVLKLRTRMADTECYCKVALCLGWDRTAAVLSFKEWKAS